ncbi:RING-type E3 ubiquitin transferase [Salvia divinorum]|uniref:RING-type E3 ubiquitin transferase n=1 Tax=Salvia divinorum TaxID=28513 RepID=A0ABD1GJ73_SALDI
MSDEGEITCPLCAEEMDLTDQQLKPCKCGYEICVWCWHHIMDMAEKDETEGRCPACRTPYNKERIVGTTASCERLVSEMNGEKKPKSSKGKNKSSEGRKQLTNMRVIQRNLVYVVGLPMNLADEDLLQCREYFGQYGKALKVSISRTATGAIQQFANSTCSVYITYSKEEEAVRCIQSVHGFVLDGKPLRACFGTTKYCHSWLRNVLCSNPECLYLHEIGSQEDSFSKDEIISAHTRVQQITGSTNSTQRRSGYALPPPADEYYNSVPTFSAKPINKTAVNTNNTLIGARVSPPNSSSGRSTALTAGSSWGTHVANNISLHTTTQCSKGALRKQDLSDGPVSCSTTAVSQSQLSSLQSDIANVLVTDKDSRVSRSKSEIEALGPVVKESKTDGKPTSSQSPNTYVHPATPPVNKQPHGPSTAKLPANITNDVNSSLVSVGLALNRDSTGTTNGKIEKIQPSHFIPNHIQENLILDRDAQLVRGAVTSQPNETTAHTCKEVDPIDVQSDFRLEMASIVTKTDLCDIEDDLLSFENQRLKDPEVAPNRSNFSHASHLSSHSNVNCTQHSKADASTCRQAIGKACNYPIGHSETILKTPEVNNAQYSNLFPSKEKRSLLGIYDGELCSNSFDMGESSIISNILSIDFDPWDESLTSPQNLAKLLGENDKQQGSFGFPGSWKNHTSNQSRFSFAREEPRNHPSAFGQSVDCFTRSSNQLSFGYGFSNSNSFQLEKLDSRNGFPAFNGPESELFAGNHSHTASNRNSVSRPQVSAPPGFSVLSRITSQDGFDQIFDGSGNHLVDSYSLLKHNYQTPPVGNTISNGDIEFIDPAILAVGKGLLPGSINNSGLDDVRTRYSSQLSTYEEAKFQSILQRSLPSHQNQRFTSMGETLSPLGDVYSMPSSVMDQTLASNMSPLSQFSVPQSRNGIISNGQWDGWNELQAGNNLGMAELLRTERLGYNKFYGGYEDSKIRMPSSGSLYNGTYGF